MICICFYFCNFFYNCNVPPMDLESAIKILLLLFIMLKFYLENKKYENDPARNDDLALSSK